MVQHKKSISVVLPNYNGKHLLEMYLPATLAALKFSQIDYEFFVIDDCSKDDSVVFIENNYPEIILLKNESNKGFSYTCNRAIKQASKDLVFLLNSDLKVEVNFFEAQFSYFNSVETFGVMGLIMNFDGKKIEDVARLPYFKGTKFKANRFYYLENPNNSTLTCYLSGANALVCRKKLQFLGGFNEIYSPFYFEDFDLGLRAWKMGWKSYYEHQSVCYHQVSASTNTLNKSNFVKIIYNRNSFILQSIHLKNVRRIIWLLQLFTSISVFHLIKGEFWILKSIKLFLAESKAIAKSRNKIKQQQQSLNVVINLTQIITIINQSIKNKMVKWL